MEIRKVIKIHVPSRQPVPCWDLRAGHNTHEAQVLTLNSHILLAESVLAKCGFANSLTTYCITLLTILSLCIGEIHLQVAYTGARFPSWVASSKLYLGPTITLGAVNKALHIYHDFRHTWSNLFVMKHKWKCLCSKLPYFCHTIWQHLIVQTQYLTEI